MPEILAPLLVKGKPFSAASVAKTVRASCGDSYQFAEGGIIQVAPQGSGFLFVGQDKFSHGYLLLRSHAAPRV